MGLVLLGLRLQQLLCLEGWITRLSFYHHLSPVLWVANPSVKRSFESAPSFVKHPKYNADVYFDRNALFFKGYFNCCDFVPASVLALFS